jgi:hypothetical protein
MSRTSNTSTTGVVDLNNTTDVNSGAQVTNAQRAINELFDADGTSGIGDANRKEYSSNNYVVDGDSRKQAIQRLDLAAGALAAEVGTKVPKFIDNAQSVNNNEATPQDITNLAFTGADYTSAIVNYEVRRVTASGSKIAVGRLFVYRQPDTGTWVLEVGDWFGQEPTLPGGLTFDLLQTGNDAQIRYTSDNLTGTGYAGTIKTSVEYFMV